MKNYVRYEDFGAVGDGIHNDFFAMKAAHEFANENRLPVKADASRKYLISSTEKDGIASSITVMTDTDFSGATVIIFTVSPKARNSSSEGGRTKSPFCAPSFSALIYGPSR